MQVTITVDDEHLERALRNLRYAHQEYEQVLSQEDLHPRTKEVYTAHRKNLAISYYALRRAILDTDLGGGALWAIEKEVDLG